MSTQAIRLEQTLSEIRALLRDATLAKAAEDRKSLP
jgi:hypothetical protein